MLRVLLCYRLKSTKQVAMGCESVYKCYSLGNSLKGPLGLIRSEGKTPTYYTSYRERVGNVIDG
jgi:hypothetical protein